MHEREHTSKHYENQLRVLKEKLLLSGYKAEISIADATRAVVERRPSLAQRVVDEDDQIDKLELEIDDICFEIDNTTSRNRWNSCPGFRNNGGHEHKSPNQRDATRISRERCFV